MPVSVKLWPWRMRNFGFVKGAIRMAETCSERAAWAVRTAIPATLLVALPLLGSKHWATSCRSPS